MTLCHEQHSASAVMRVSNADVMTRGLELGRCRGASGSGGVQVLVGGALGALEGSLDLGLSLVAIGPSGSFD